MTVTHVREVRHAETGPSPVRCSVSTASLLTVGHGTLDREGLGSLLASAGAQALVDVRRFPHSRHNRDVATEALGDWLPAMGIAYRWDVRLGGRRKLPVGPSPDTWWLVESFRAYAAHTRTTLFVEAFDELLATASGATTVIMCGESVWWRCHRRLIADVAVLGHGVPVLHLMPDGRTSAHRPSEGARADGPDRLVWDG